MADYYPMNTLEASAQIWHDNGFWRWLSGTAHGPFRSHEEAAAFKLPRAKARKVFQAPEITVDEWVDGERRYRVVQHNGEMRLKANELDAEDHSCFVDLMRRVRQLRHSRRVP